MAPLFSVDTDFVTHRVIWAHVEYFSDGINRLKTLTVCGESPILDDLEHAFEKKHPTCMACATRFGEQLIEWMQQRAQSEGAIFRMRLDLFLPDDQYDWEGAMAAAPI